MSRFGTVTAILAATWLALTIVAPMAQSTAAQDDATSSIVVDPVNTLEMHTTANCVKADDKCYFTTTANFLTPDGPTGFPNDFYAKQTTTLRSMNRGVYLDSDFVGANTRMFKSITDNEFATVYFGGGPPEKFTLRGSTRTVDWRTGKPKTDADYIVCAHIQIVYGPVNLTSPDACAQTTY